VARYGATLLEKFAAHTGSGSSQSEVRKVPLGQVTAGMVMMQELRTDEGTLLAPRGLEISALFLERMRSFGPGLLAEQVKVLIPAPKAIG